MARVGYPSVTFGTKRGRVMNEHRLHQTGSYATRTVARRRRVHEARRRMAGMKARMAELRSTTAVDHLTGPDHVWTGDRTG